LFPILSACGGGGDAPPAVACASYDVIFAASDYSVASAVGGFSVSANTGHIWPGVDLGADPALTTSNGRAFFIARDADAIVELQPRCGQPLQRYSTADAARRGTTNPQDVAVDPVSGDLFVPRFDEPSLLVLSASGQPVGNIDLSSFDGDGNPNASSVRIVTVGGAPKAFVTLERLDDTDMLKSKQPSFMLVVDVTSRTAEGTVVLAGRNPFNLMVEAAGAFYLAEPGNFDATDEPLAGIERFDPQTRTTALLVHEQDLGGSVAEVALSADGACGAAIVADATPGKNRTSLVTFDARTGAVLAPASAAVLGPTDNYDLEGLAWKGGALFVGDRRAAPSFYRVHVFDRTGACTLTERPAVVALPQKPVALRAVE
jgi:hypothetical protein